MTNSKHATNPENLVDDHPYARVVFEGWRNEAGTRTLYLGELSIAVVQYATDIDKEHVDYLVRAVNAYKTPKEQGQQ